VNIPEIDFASAARVLKVLLKQIIKNKIKIKIK